MNRTKKKSKNTKTQEKTIKILNKHQEVVVSLGFDASLVSLAVVLNAVGYVLQNYDLLFEDPDFQRMFSSKERFKSILTEFSQSMGKIIKEAIEETDREDDGSKNSDYLRVHLKNEG